MRGRGGAGRRARVEVGGEGAETPLGLQRGDSRHDGSEFSAVGAIGDVGAGDPDVRNARGELQLRQTGAGRWVCVVRVVVADAGRV